MTLREEMLAAARRGRAAMGDESWARAGEFVGSQMDPSGAFHNRRGRSDLYYTAFGVEASAALGVELPWLAIERYLLGFGAGETLDLVHLTCLARAWAEDPQGVGEITALGIASRLEANRSGDGGYNHLGPQPSGSAYGCFLALGAYEDLSLPPPNIEQVGECLATLRRRDGSYANDVNMPMGVSTATAAAAMVLSRLGVAPPSELARWLLSCHHPQGGFSALPRGPLADLLSTATTLHALRAMNVSLAEIAEPCRQFVRGLQTPSGGFKASLVDPAADCEYTFYGLLAMGHLTKRDEGLGTRDQEMTKSEPACRQAGDE